MMRTSPFVCLTFVERAVTFCGVNLSVAIIELQEWFYKS